MQNFWRIHTANWQVTVQTKVKENSSIEKTAQVDVGTVVAEFEIRDGRAEMLSLLTKNILEKISNWASGEWFTSTKPWRENCRLAWHADNWVIRMYKRSKELQKWRIWKRGSFSSYWCKTWQCKSSGVYPCSDQETVRQPSSSEEMVLT